MKLYTIPQGCKSTGVRVSLRSYTPNQEFTFKLTASALYSPADLNATADSREFRSIQKVGGFSLDLFRTVDIRLGYNCTAADGFFELFSYVDYHRKRWEWKRLGACRPEKTYTGRITTNPATNEYRLVVDAVGEIISTLPVDTAYGMGWNLFPYVEYGDLPAVRDTTIGWQQL